MIIEQMSINDRLIMFHKSINDLFDSVSKLRELNASAFMRCDQNNAEAINRIEKLEAENIMRQDTIACVDRAYDEQCEQIHKRIENLEKLNQQCFDANPIGTIEKQLYELKKENLTHGVLIKILTNDLNLAHEKIKKLSGKVPHTCPNCYGQGYKGTSMINRQDCDACKGEGVLWG